MTNIRPALRCAILLALLAAVGPVGRGDAAEGRNRKTIESYVVPDADLINQDGEKVRLKDLLKTDKPVMLDFIYSTCTTTCPVLSTAFSNIQNRLGPDAHRVRMISISTDPENDTPEAMKRYLKMHRAKPGWDYLTGSPGEILKVMKAFELKDMSYNYFTLIRDRPDGRWVKITGRLDPAKIIEEYLR